MLLDIRNLSVDFQTAGGLFRAVDSVDILQRSEATRINFSKSAGAYGEIEDLARRICWNLQNKTRTSAASTARPFCLATAYGAVCPP